MGNYNNDAYDYCISERDFIHHSFIIDTIKKEKVVQRSILLGHSLERNSKKKKEKNAVENVFPIHREES